MEDLAVIEPETALASFRPIAPVIATMLEKYTGLKIDGLKDRSGLKAVHEARIEVKSVRVGIEKTRKEVKSAVLAYGKKIDSEAERLTGLILPLETLLAAKDAVTIDRK